MKNAVGSVEFGKCEICGKETFLQRTVWSYGPGRKGNGDRNIKNR